MMDYYEKMNLAFVILVLSSGAFIGFFFLFWWLLGSRLLLLPALFFGGIFGAMTCMLMTALWLNTTIHDKEHELQMLKVKYEELAYRSLGIGGGNHEQKP